MIEYFILNLNLERDYEHGKIKSLFYRLQGKVRRGTSNEVKKTSEKINGYEVILSTKKNFKKAKKVTTKKNAVTVKKLKAGKKYFVKVRAFKKVGNKKIYGKYSTVKKVIVKK